MQKLLISAVLCASLVSACTVHKLDIQQGNVVTPEMVEKLKPGMTTKQVKFVMGSPQLTDPFHRDRWDYLYTLSNNGKTAERKHLILYFEGDLLSRIVGQTPGASQQ
jgi:outer membrane protein assembly factor BamE